MFVPIHIPKNAVTDYLERKFRHPLVLLLAILLILIYFSWCYTNRTNFLSSGSGDLIIILFCLIGMFYYQYKEWQILPPGGVLREYD